VVTVASQAERFARLDFDDLNWEHRPYQASRAYNDSKLANLLFTAELQRRLTAGGSPVLANAAHPGLVATSIYHHDGPRRPADRAWSIALRLLAQDAGHGALPVLFAAVAACPETASPVPATWPTCAVLPSSSPAPPPRRTRTSPAASGPLPSSSPASAPRSDPYLSPTDVDRPAVHSAHAEPPPSPVPLATEAPGGALIRRVWDMMIKWRPTPRGCTG
jgi:hypothetical protein